mgnify:CR=1 FL=1
MVMKSDQSLEENDPMNWQKAVPYDTRQEAIADAITAFKGCLTKMKQGLINHFDVSFRSKKAQTSQAFKVNKNALNLETMEIFPRRLKKSKTLRMRKRDKRKKLRWFQGQKTPDGNFTIIKTRPNKWYICLPVKVVDPTTNSNNMTNPYKSVFMDPGVRSFQTLYSPDGICGKIGGPEFNNQLETLAKKHDRLWSKSDLTNNQRTRQHLKRRCALIRWKMKNKVTDLHWQTCSFLCSTFDLVFLPRFEVSDMVQGSPLGSKITRKMLQLSHGAFRERLLYFARTKQCKVYLVGEQYSTKTCGNCGNLQPMNGLKVYNCSQCGQKLDRDYNGARNICLKVMSQLSY